MWTFKEFKTKKELQEFIEKNKNNIQWEEVFINNGFCIEYRKLRKVYFN